VTGRDTPPWINSGVRALAAQAAMWHATERGVDVATPAGARERRQLEDDLRDRLAGAIDVPARAASAKASRVVQPHT
jgi:hypothetical protein